MPPTGLKTGKSKNKLSSTMLYVCWLEQKNLKKNAQRRIMKYKNNYTNQWTFYSATSIFEVWDLRFEKSGLRNLVREIWFKKSGWPEKKVVLYYKSTFFQVGEKWLTRKKNPSLKNHFSRTTFLHFFRIEVAE